MQSISKNWISLGMVRIVLLGMLLRCSVHGHAHCACSRCITPYVLWFYWLHCPILWGGCSCWIPHFSSHLFVHHGKNRVCSTPVWTRAVFFVPHSWNQEVSVFHCGPKKGSFVSDRSWCTQIQPFGESLLPSLLIFTPAPTSRSCCCWCRLSSLGFCVCFFKNASCRLPWEGKGKGILENDQHTWM